MNASKLYIFDMGGVVSLNCDVIPPIIWYLNVEKRDFFQWAERDFKLLLEGRLTAGDFWHNLSKHYGQPVREELFGKFFEPEPNPAMVELIDRLKKGSRVVCGTNTIDPHYDIHLRRGDYDFFHAVYASNRMGMAKPDPDFYLHILEKENMKPEQTVFIDDRGENIVSAAHLGIEAILFQDPSTLVEQIE